MILKFGGMVFPVILISPSIRKLQARKKIEKKLIGLKGNWDMEHKILTFKGIIAANKVGRGAKDNWNTSSLNLKWRWWSCVLSSFVFISIPCRNLWQRKLPGSHFFYLKQVGFMNIWVDSHILHITWLQHSLQLFKNVIIFTVEGGSHI